MPSPRTALRTERAQASGWSRGRAGTPTHSWACVVSRRPSEDPVAGRQRSAPPRSRTAAPLPRPKARINEGQGLGVGDVAGDRDDRVRRPIAVAPELADPARFEAPDIGLLAADLAAERPAPEHRLLEQDLAVLGGIVEVAADLLDDDVALAVDLGVVEGGPADQLTEDVDRASRLAARDARPVDGRFAVRRRVERAADALDRLAQRAGRRIRRGPLEGQVLEEVGDADLSVDLGSRSGQDVGGDRHGSRARELGADHPRPVGQDGSFEHRPDGTRSHAGRVRRRNRTAGARRAPAVQPLRSTQRSLGQELGDPLLEEEDREADRDDPHQGMDFGHLAPRAPG